MSRTRGQVVATVVSLALYLSGLQKRVLDPVLRGFAELGAGVQLAVIAAVAVTAATAFAIRARTRRAELVSAIATIHG